MDFDLTSEELDQLTAVSPVDIRVAAMDFLARREHSLWELRRKLKRRFTDEVLIDSELKRLRAENLQSDQRFAESFVRQRIARGSGPLRLRQELRQRGLSNNEIERAVAAADVDWCAVAQQVLDKKFGKTPAVDIKEKARRSRFMQYRGFSSDHFRDIL